MATIGYRFAPDHNSDYSGPWNERVNGPNPEAMVGVRME